MLTKLMRLTVGGVALAMMAACATTLEPDGRLDSARDLVSQAAAFGTDRAAYSQASTYLEGASEAFEDGDAEDYDTNIRLTQAYAGLAIAQGESDEAKEVAQTLQGELETLEARAMACSEELASCRAQFSDLSSVRLSGDLAALAGTMKCARTGGTGGTVQLACNGLTFAFDSSRLLPVTDARLAAMAEFMKLHPGASVQIVGHTDSVGPEDVNMRLSQARAASVKAFLETAGIDAGRLSATGMGESQPLADNATRSGRAMNRRVDFVISGLSMASSS